MIISEVSTAFFNMNHDKGVAKELVDILNEAKQAVPDWLDKCRQQASFGGRGGGRGGRGGRGRGARFGASDYRRDGPKHQAGGQSSSSWGNNGGSNGSTHQKASWF
jgi:ATP-dependent RNA helicase DDX3X